MDGRLADIECFLYTLIGHKKGKKIELHEPFVFMLAQESNIAFNSTLHDEKQTFTVVSTVVSLSAWAVQFSMTARSSRVLVRPIHIDYPVTSITASTKLLHLRKKSRLQGIHNHHCYYEGDKTDRFVWLYKCFIIIISQNIMYLHFLKFFYLILSCLEQMHRLVC